MNISWWESVSVVESTDEDGKVLQWPVIVAQFDCEAISLTRPELEITPEEAARIVDNLLGAMEEAFDDDLESWLEEVRP